jgi:hypothetical protein
MIKACWILSGAFLCLLRWSSVCMCVCFITILYILHILYILDTTHMAYCILTSVHCLIRFASVFFSFYLFTNYISTYFSHGKFVWLWYQDHYGLIECLRKFALVFFGRVWLGLMLILLYLIEFTRKSVWEGIFLSFWILTIWPHYYWYTFLYVYSTWTLFFWWHWGLNSRREDYKGGSLSLKPYLKPQLELLHDS